MTTSDMTAFLTSIGDFFTWSVTQLSTVLSTIIASPALTVLCLAMPICGFCVGLLNRFIRVG